MQLEFAFVADAAQASPDGKISALGAGINVISAEKFPATHPYMSLVVKIELHGSECDRPHNLEVELWDSDGSRVGGTRLSSPFSVPKPDGGRPAYAQMVLNLVGVTFDRAGDYAFQIVVDGQHLKTVSLYLVQL